LVGESGCGESTGKTILRLVPWPKARSCSMPTDITRLAIRPWHPIAVACK
jgi:ABC-type dipeptide/oligopeptide/nickel transport system ATPase component